MRDASIAYLRKLRMEKAMDLIRHGEMNITEIAYDIGYNSISPFSKIFAEYFGIKPSQFRSLCSVKK
ncbi:MAG: helix-turn-helix transcriptional regulator [Thermodesulfobacteriota bacterium]|nr:helix-turn-helix transcriptional regulator [Thermodesulfobacteriota bacterium]